MPAFLTVKVFAWICAALVAVIAGLGLYIWGQGVALGHMENERDKAQNQLIEAKKTIKGQVDALKECSDRTDALKAEGVKRQAAADEALATARKEAARHQQANQKRDAALKAPTPKGAGCREAVLDLRKGLR